MELTEYEIKLLRDLSGDTQPDIQWGAAMSASLGPLVRGGYLSRQGTRYEITEQGREAVN